jgi:hypothetical protein
MNARALVLVLMSMPLFATPPLRAQAADNEGELHQPTRPGMARPADIQRRGVLQLEVGMDSRLHAPEVQSEQTVQVSVRYSVVKSFAIEADIEPVRSEVDRPSRVRHTGFGDVVVGAQWVGLNEAPSHPAVAVAYYEKLPTAPTELGTSRVDHRLVVLLSKQVHHVDVDIDGAYLNVGRAAGGRVSGTMMAVSASREFTNKLGYVAEVSYQTQDADGPRGAHALAAVTYRLSERMRLDAGTRAGLTADAPRFSVTGGISVGLPLSSIR